MANIKFTKYYADWCIPCKRMQPIIEELKTEHPEVDFSEFNIESDMDKVQALGVSSVPTFIVEKDGVEVARKTGMSTKAELEALIA